MESLITVLWLAVLVLVFFSGYYFGKAAGNSETREILTGRKR